MLGPWTHRGGVWGDSLCTSGCSLEGQGRAACSRSELPVLGGMRAGAGAFRIREGTVWPDGWDERLGLPEPPPASEPALAAQRLGPTAAICWKRSCVRCSAPRGPGLPGPVTDDFPCLSGRPANGRGRWGLQGRRAGSRPPQGSRHWTCNSGVDPSVGPSSGPPRPAQRSALLPSPLARSRSGALRGARAGWRGTAFLLSRGRAARGARGLCGCPGQAGERPEPRPCQPSAHSCGGRREAAANLYTKCF